MVVTGARAGAMRLLVVRAEALAWWCRGRSGSHPNCIGHDLFVYRRRRLRMHGGSQGFIVTCETEQAQHAWSQRGSLGDSRGVVRKHYRLPLVFYFVHIALFSNLVRTLEVDTHVRLLD